MSEHEKCYRSLKDILASFGKSNHSNSKNPLSCMYPQTLRIFLNLKMLTYLLRRTGGRDIEAI